jgi:hypothetical protein
MTLARDLPPASPLGLDIDAKGALRSMVANPVTAFLALSIQGHGQVDVEVGTHSKNR